MATASSFLNPSNNNQRKFITPKIKREIVNGDDVIKITGFVEGVKIVGYEYKNESTGKQAVITFGTNEGATINKYFNEFKDETTDKAKNFNFRNLSELAVYFYGLEYVQSKLKTGSGEEIDFKTIQQLADALFSNAPTSKEGQLKMVFKEKEGKYPKYVFTNYNWFGDDLYFTKEEKAELLEFKVVEEVDASDATHGSDPNWVTGNTDSGLL